MRADLLLLLADRIEKLPPHRFDFATWVGHEWAGREDLSCGTTACALGWAATMPEFRDLGLRLVRTRHMKNLKGVVCLASNLDANGAIRVGELTPSESCLPFNAAADVFGISYEDAEYLFSSNDELDEDASAYDVAEHIRRFVENYS